jgi:dTDP-4-dehydrorhamnose reductase
MKNILVTGAGGQVGQEIQTLAGRYPLFQFNFVTHSLLDITNEKAVSDFITTNETDLVINCAAYTAVDKAESEPDKAYAVNAIGANNLAKSTKKKGIPFIHISTDFVFDGEKASPYSETDSTNALGVYASTKLEGEKLALQENPRTIVVRTSWVYSSFGNNFVKTMLRLGKEKPELRVVNDQTGSPTYAADLAKALLDIADKIDSVKAYGLFHYSNSGEITWYQFAKTILELKDILTPVHPITTAQFPTPAKRPKYSVFNKNKIQQVYGIHINDWKQSLKACLEKL